MIAKARQKVAQFQVPTVNREEKDKFDREVRELRSQIASGDNSFRKGALHSPFIVCSKSSVCAEAIYIVMNNRCKRLHAWCQSEHS